MTCIRQSAVLAIAALVASSAAFAQSYTLSPAAPTPMDMITVTKPFNNEEPAKTVVTMSGNRITVTLGLLDVLFPEPPPGTFEQAVGRLPPGDYDLEVTYAGGASLGTTHFTVAARVAGQPVDDFTDMWWNPEESGWGLNIAQHASGELFATWFVYASDGTPLWYVVPGGHWVDADAFQGDLYRTSGPDMAHFSADAVTRTKVGSVTFAFGSNGLFAIFNVDGKQTTKLLQRQSF